MNRALFHAGLWVNLGSMLFNLVLIVISSIESRYTWVWIHGILFVLATVLAFIMLYNDLRSRSKRALPGALAQ